LKPSIGVRLQALLALGLLLLAVAAVAGVALVPLWQTSERYDEAIADVQQRLAVARRVAAAGAGLEPLLAEFERGHASDARYLKSASQTLASAELQGIVNRAIVSKRGQILSTQIVDAAREQRPEQVTLGVSMRATLEQAVEIFYLLETGNPHLFIENVDVRRRAYVGAIGRHSSAAPAGPTPLDVQFEVSGYLRGEAG
jgi:general secretion pathway protein M